MSVKKNIIKVSLIIFGEKMCQNAYYSASWGYNLVLNDFLVASGHPTSDQRGDNKWLKIDFFGRSDAVVVF